MKKVFLQIVILVLLVSNSIANETNSTKKTEENKKKNSKDAVPSSGKFGFGLGFGVMNLNKPDITNTTVDNGTIRVTGEEKQKLGVWLTASWINEQKFDYLGFGPFFGVQLGGNDEIVNSFAVGIDFSLKKIEPALPLDFQLGWAWSKTTVLADGYNENQAIPNNGNQVLTKDIVTNGPVLIVSYKF